MTDIKTDMQNIEISFVDKKFHNSYNFITLNH